MGALVGPLPLATCACVWSLLAQLRAAVSAFVAMPVGGSGQHAKSIAGTAC